MTASVIYEGQLRCTITHNQSGTVIETDAPTDNKGKGQRFSPTDLVCVSLATCMITTMGIKTQDMNIALEGVEIVIQKHMVSDPRRIGKIELTLRFPKGLNLSEKDKTLLERIGNTCPVAKSLHPDVEQQVVYEW